MTEYAYRFITTADPLYAAERALRSRVLREPLGFPAGAELFPFEDESYHLVALEGDRVVGCAMFHPEGERDGRLMQMAVDPDFQKQDIGSELVGAMEERLHADGFAELHLHARHYAIPFYERLGFVLEGEPFEEIGIEHRRMRKSL